MSNINKYFNFSSGNEIQNRIDNHEEWLVEDLIPNHGLIGFIGPLMISKSLLAMNLAVSIATGTNFLGKKTKKGKVLYFDSHNSDQILATRIQGLAQNNDDLGNLLICKERLDNINNHLTINNGFIEELQNIINSFQDKPSLIILDRWDIYRSSKMTYQAEFSEACKLKKFAFETGIPILIVGLSGGKNLKRMNLRTSNTVGILGAVNTSFIFNWTKNTHERSLTVDSDMTRKKEIIVNFSNYPIVNLLKEIEC